MVNLKDSNNWGSKYEDTEHRVLKENWVPILKSFFGRGKRGCLDDKLFLNFGCKLWGFGIFLEVNTPKSWGKIAPNFEVKKRKKLLSDVSSRNTSDDSRTTHEGEKSDVEVSNHRCTIPTQGSTRSYVWEYFKILKNNDPRWLKHNHTHKCILCDFSQVISLVELKSSTAVAYIVQQLNLD